MDKVVFNHEQLQERLAYWQEKLRLRDWIIIAEIVRASELDSNCAQIKHVFEIKQAKIKIMADVDWPEDAWCPNDMEWSLVHELLHLHFAPLQDDDSENDHIYTEQAIESIAYGLVNANRHGDKFGI